MEEPPDNGRDHCQTQGKHDPYPLLLPDLPHGNCRQRAADADHGQGRGHVAHKTYHGVKRLRQLYISEVNHQGNHAGNQSVIQNIPEGGFFHRLRVIFQGSVLFKIMGAQGKHKQIKGHVKNCDIEDCHIAKQGLHHGKSHKCRVCKHKHADIGPFQKFRHSHDPGKYIAQSDKQKIGQNPGDKNTDNRLRIVMGHGSHTVDDNTGAGNLHNHGGQPPVHPFIEYILFKQIKADPHGDQQLAHRNGNRHTHPLLSF